MAIQGGTGILYLDQSPALEGITPNETQSNISEITWDTANLQLYYWNRATDTWTAFPDLNIMQSSITGSGAQTQVLGGKQTWTMNTQDFELTTATGKFLFDESLNKLDVGDVANAFENQTTANTIQLIDGAGSHQNTIGTRFIKTSNQLGADNSTSQALWLAYTYNDNADRGSVFTQYRAGGTFAAPTAAQTGWTAAEYRNQVHNGTTFLTSARQRNVVRNTLNGTLSNDLSSTAFIFENNFNGVSDVQGTFTIEPTGQLTAPLYTSATSFTGTATGYLAFDASGNIISEPVPSDTNTFLGLTDTPGIYGVSLTPRVNAAGNAIEFASYTTGSVLFGGPVGQISEDNGNFFWDDTNNRLGIKTSSPESSLELNGSLSVVGTTVVADYTATENDLVLNSSTAGTQTITLPDAGGLSPLSRVYIIKNSGTGTTNIVDAAGNNVDGAATKTISTQGDSTILYANAGEWIEIANKMTGDGNIIQNSITGTTAQTQVLGGDQTWTVGSNDFILNTNASTVAVDGSLDKLYIGDVANAFENTTNTKALQIVETSGTSQSTLLSRILKITSNLGTNTGAAQARLDMTTYNSSQSDRASYITLRRLGGTFAAPTAVQAGDEIGKIQYWGGRDAGGVGASPIGEFSFEARNTLDATDNDFSSSAFIFRNIHNGASSINPTFTIEPTGQLTAPSYTSSTSFTGTEVAGLSVDASGNIITVTPSVNTNIIEASITGTTAQTQTLGGQQTWTMGGNNFVLDGTQDFTFQDDGTLFATKYTDTYIPYFGPSGELRETDQLVWTGGQTGESGFALMKVEAEDSNALLVVNSHRTNNINGSRLNFGKTDGTKTAPTNITYPTSEPLLGNWNRIGEINAFAQTNGVNNTQYAVIHLGVREDGDGLGNKTGFVYLMATDDLDQSSGERLIWRGEHGGLALESYTSATSHTGTAVGSLQFDASGNILTAAVPTDTNFATSNLTADAARTHDFASNSLDINALTSFGMQVDSTTESDIDFTSLADGAWTLSNYTSFGAIGPTYVMNKAAGTRAVPTAIALTTKIGEIRAQGYNGAGYNIGGQIIFQSTEGFSATEAGTLMDFRVSSNDATTPTTRLTLNPTGFITMGDYGSGTQAGTATRYAAWDAAGQLIEEAIPTNIATAAQTATGNYLQDWAGNQLSFDNVSFFQVQTDGTSMEGIMNYDAGTSADLRLESYGDAATAYSRLVLNKNSGTAAAPTVVDNGDLIGEIYFTGYNGTAERNAGVIRVQAQEAWSGVANGSRMRFLLTTNGNTSEALVMTLNEDSQVTFHQYGTGAFENLTGRTRDLAVDTNGNIIEEPVHLPTQIYYVSPTGNDVDGEAGNMRRPYLTAATAFALMGAGDTLYFLPGSHTVTTLTDTNGVNFVVSGGATLTIATGNVFIANNANTKIYNHGIVNGQFQVSAGGAGAFIGGGGRFIASNDSGGVATIQGNCTFDNIRLINTSGTSPFGAVYIGTPTVVTYETYANVATTGTVNEPIQTVVINAAVI